MRYTKKARSMGESTTWTRTLTHWALHKLDSKPQGWRCTTKVTRLTPKLQTPVNRCPPAPSEHTTAYPFSFLNDQPFPLFSRDARGYPTSPGVPGCTFICYLCQIKAWRGELSSYFHLVPTVIFLSVKLTFGLSSHILPLILKMHLFYTLLGFGLPSLEMLICVTGFPDPTPSTWVTEAASDFPGALGSEAFSAALYTLEDQ